MSARTPISSLMLSGGGARAAYQAGVLSAIGEICTELRIAHPFHIYTGVSAGALNACLLTSQEGTFSEGCKKLIDLWSTIKSEDVYISNPWSLTYEGLHWIADLSLGGMKKATPGKSLINTAPLKEMIEKNCAFENIHKKIKQGDILGVGVTALDYFNASSVTFMQAHTQLPSWERVRRRSEAVEINADHLMASAAIPLIFPPINIDNKYYGDGSIRNLSPCAPAIYMGADKILAIGVRCHQDVCFTQKAESTLEPPNTARILSVMLNAVMIDGIELDIERIERINKGMQNILESEREKLSIRPIQTLWISPSRDLSTIAANRSTDLPRMIRYLLRGLGSLEEAGEITSFLLFDTTFCKKLIELGFNDGMRQKDKIKKFLTD
ncbi:patatin-like phospholipase family protein [Bdellovibrio svalbardensis]|uniref:Patatin-like phospholipase family protein n=1 Tax=Bdellovibrio svalbardensis TaxID=2972972 RepID=A0ABT6DID8_9BACT|nr:patatin-like phospholipase family protein [Bdellovibrio svalbardensis]MDG0816610.1 patatin-like phospholipase family protein [Bdellovibrio svalbardensis]